MFARPFAFRVIAQPCPKTSLPHGFYSPNPSWRYFSSSIPRTKAAGRPLPKQSQPKPKSTAEPEETLKFAGRRPIGFAKLERRVAKEGDIILFKAPSHRSYVLGAYGIAFFCFAYSVYNSNAVFRDPLVPLPRWQQALTGGICIVMSVMGTVFLVKTARLIRSIKATNVQGQALLRFTVRSIMPFRKPYEFDALPRQVLFSRRLVVSPDAHRPERMQARTASSVTSFWKAPGKQMSMLMYRVFRSIRQIFTQEDLILLEVEGQKGVFRMDSAGYVSEDFLVVGNPVDVKRPRA